MIVPKPSHCGKYILGIQRKKISLSPRTSSISAFGQTKKLVGTSMAQVLYVLVSVCPHHCQGKRFWWCQDQKVSKEEVNMQRPSECAEHMVNKERLLCKAHDPHQTTYKISRQKVFCSQNCTKLRISNSFWWLWSDQSTSSFLQLLWTPCVSSVKTSRLVQYKCWRYEEKKK